MSYNMKDAYKLIATYVFPVPDEYYGDRLHDMAIDLYIKDVGLMKVKTITVATYAGVVESGGVKYEIYTPVK